MPDLAAETYPLTRVLALGAHASACSLILKHVPRPIFTTDFLQLIENQVDLQMIISRKIFERIVPGSASYKGMKMFMSKSNRLKQSDRTPMVPEKPARAFTLTELVVVIGTIALLAMTLLPALAGAQNKGGRAQCANNLRQIGVATMIYATEYRDWLPIDTVHPSSINVLNGMWYTRYVVSGPANTFVPTNPANGSGMSFTDLGLVYHADLAGNGSIFYCPEQWGTPLGANNYSPLLTTDSSAGGIYGVVRSSYAFNPRITDPANTNNLPYTQSFLRLYQKTSDLPPHKLFTVDYFDMYPAPSTPSHFRERGWNVLFTDGSVQFSQNVLAHNLIQNFVNTETIQSHEQADQIFNCLELDH